MDLISVIVPIYNRENRLDKCITSIINQTYRNLEIILINDGSTDNSLEKCYEYQRLDSRIKVVDKTNGGVSSARNEGIKNSCGDFIQFVDSDDYIELNMCETLLRYSQKENSDIIICGNKKEYSGKIYLNKCLNKTVKDISEIKEDFSMLYERYIFNSPCNKLYKRDIVITYFNEKISLGEDLVFNLSNLKNTHKVTFIEDCLYNYVKSCKDRLTNEGFREDKFNIALMLYDEVNTFCDYYGIEECYRDGVNTVFVNNILVLIYFLVNDNSINLVTKKQLILEYINDSRLSKAIINYKGKKFRFNLINNVIKIRNIELIYISFRLINFVERVIGKLK